MVPGKEEEVVRDGALERGVGGVRLCFGSIGSHVRRGGGLGSSTIFKKFHETYAPS